MENKCTMVTTNTGGLGLREEEEIELDLGLSIGGSSSSSFKKVEKFKPIKKESFDTDLRGNQNHKSFGLVDPLMKREIQALRRQEAKKKREEKQQKKGICRANRNGDHANAADIEARECKRSRREDIKHVNLNLSIEENMNQPELCPVVPVQYPYPYPHPKPCPFTKGFAYPGVTGMPCWATGGAERNVVAGSRRFRPLHAGQANGSADGGNRKTTSNGSSAVSDNRSSSHEAGGSSDTKSHSSHSLREQHQLNGSHDHSGSSHLMEVSQVTEETTNCVENMVPSDISQSSPTKPKEESVSDTQPISTEKSVSNQSPSPLEETKGDMSKPPRPQIQNRNTPSLPHMPCVSTTGNGPNGKTINGFLYRYTKTEVSIVCVCHGTSFSPAEFVQHAGGTDITNPLRQITVIPSAF